jgi:MoaA/NifB/PqqE/SkfB family radical SAM enzyme
MIKEDIKITTLEIKANYTCNAKCDYCCISNRKEKRSMTHEEIAENVMYFKKKYGIREVCLSGGEPTVHKSFLNNLQFVHSQGLTIYLHTNAIKFSDREFTEQAAPYIDRALAGLSFHNESLCKEITGNASTFEKRIEGIKNLLALDVPVRTNTVIVKSNYRYLHEISKMISTLGTKKALFTLPFFFERKESQVDQFIPDDFFDIKPFLHETIDYLTEKNISVFLQGLPPCKLDEFIDYREIDPDRAFVDSFCQLEKHSFLFSGMLGYSQNEECKGCEYSLNCWGYPLPGALGEMGTKMSLPA